MTSETLRLADRLRGGWGLELRREAEAELRRLHDDYENALKHFAEAVEGYKQMADQRDALLEALQELCDTLGECGMTEKARAAIAKAEENT